MKRPRVKVMTQVAYVKLDTPGNDHDEVGLRFGKMSEMDQTSITSANTNSVYDNRVWVKNKTFYELPLQDYKEIILKVRRLKQDEVKDLHKGIDEDNMDAELNNKTTPKPGTTRSTLVIIEGSKRKKVLEDFIWHARNAAVENPPWYSQTSVQLTSIPVVGLLGATQREMRAGLCMENYRKFLSMVINAFVTSSLPEIYQFLMENINQIPSLEDAIQHAEKYE